MKRSYPPFARNTDCPIASSCTSARSSRARICRYCLTSIAQSDQPLVVAGKLGWLTEPILAKVKELGIQDRVTFTGFVADDDLPALISAATLLAMPSKYEGFGLPVLEAMACGTPVIASNRSSLPEVGGDAALYARPNDPASWAHLIELVWNDDELKASLRERGFKQAAKFKWSTMARETAEVYRANSL